MSHQAMITRSLPPMLMACAITWLATAEELRLSMIPSVELSWPTTSGNLYQLQMTGSPDGPWSDLGPPVAGDGSIQTRVEPAGAGQQIYQVMETVPGTDPAPMLPVNGGFEAADGGAAANWTVSGSQPPSRSGTTAHGGSFSMRSALANAGSAPSEAGLSQRIAIQGAAVTAGQSYDFSFRAKQVSAGPSYVQQYQVQWLNSAGTALGGGTGLTNFNGSEGTWVKISHNGLVAPAGTADARVLFRFVTGAVAGGHGEVFIDDVILDSGTTATGVPAETRALPVIRRPVVSLSWPSSAGILYQPVATTDLRTWNPMSPAITGDGGLKSLTVPMDKPAEFFRLEIPPTLVLPPAGLQAVASGIPGAIRLTWTASTTGSVTGYRILHGLSADDLDQSMEVGSVTTATLTGLQPGQTYYLSVVALAPGGESPAGAATLSAPADADSGIVALFNSLTPLEAETTLHTPEALITRVGDRARDRHAREGMFSAYDHYLSWYWQERTIGLEIIDRVAKGGTTLTFNYQTLTPLGQPEFRAFYRGIGTVAEYHFNLLAPLIGPNLYSATLTSKLPENRPLQVGDRVEIEVSQFIQAPQNGRNNYYGTAILYVVGQGIVPWEAKGPLMDSHPLPASAWLGGGTTLPYQYSNEPTHRFKQTAGNISPASIQPFMQGRRLHHTDFGNGAHSEPGNPDFTAHAGKLGPKFIARSCVACHVNNGRALPPAIGAPMLQSVVKVAADASGTPHPLLGAVLQPQATSGAVEGSAVISGYTSIHGQYADGTPYTLRKPSYAFQGVTPSHFSVRLTPPLVGNGLLEAVPESTVLNLADPDDADQDGISGRVRSVTDPENSLLRLGRFTAKGGQATVKHQIAAALNNDMGVPTSIFPIPDGGTMATTPELGDSELDELARYIALLGVGARRDLTNAQALQGEQLFTTASCNRCHTPTLTTSPHHPMTELRNQTIHPYTDLLLHDMGAGLADNLGEGTVSGSEWRTAPLWNIGFTAEVSGGEAYLHDGRARSIEEAILWHGGEAEASKQAFIGMSAADRAALVRFIQSL
jgi:CxxC motif-containing protein (DUF1111 family)